MDRVHRWAFLLAVLLGIFLLVFVPLWWARQP